MTNVHMTEAGAFIRANTVVASPPLVPEIKLHLATEITPIWQATEDALREHNLPPPFWAFCWPGGQALARYVLDNPATVRGRRVLDFATGCGVSAIAAAMAGAESVLANDIDPYAIAATGLNAAMNDAAVECSSENLVGGPNLGWDVVITGDVCYERPMSDAVTSWLKALSAEGAVVLMGDPGRTYLPDGTKEIAVYHISTSLELEDRDIRRTLIMLIE